MKQLVVFTTPDAAEVLLYHDDAGGTAWPGTPGTVEGRTTHLVNIPDGTADGHGARLVITHDKRVPLEQRGTLWLSHRADGFAEFAADDFRLVQAVTPFDPLRLPRLVTRGQFFALETGERFTAIQCSDFNLYARWLKEGPEAVEPVMAQRAALGFNMVRVWTYMQLSQYGIGDLNPHDYPDFYQRIPAFCGHLATHGLYAEFTAYTGSPGREDRSHWAKLGAAAQQTSNAPLELVNENNQAGNHLDAAQFQRIPGVCCAHGSNGSESWPVDEPWDYETYHTNGAFEWQRKVGHNAMEIADARGRPVLSNENTRFADNDASEAHAEDAAEASALLNGGSCFHSVEGKRSALFTGQTLVCAQAWTRGARAVPLEFQDGRYIRHDDLAPGVIRKYERRLNDGRGHVVEIRA